MKNSDLTAVCDELTTMPEEVSVGILASVVAEKRGKEVKVPLVCETVSAGMELPRITVPAGVSNRHVHLSRASTDVLFGRGHTLVPFRALRQPGQFAAQECVSVVGPKGVLTRVRVLGPVRPVTQLEISRGDSFILGIDAPVRESGCLSQSGSVLLVGPAGYVGLHSQVICAMRHIHLSPEEARQAGVKHGQRVRVKCEGERGVIFDEVVVRVSADFVAEFHIDTEEANAAGLKNGDPVWLLP